MVPNYSENNIQLQEKPDLGPNYPEHNKQRQETENLFGEELLQTKRTITMATSNTHNDNNKMRRETESKLCFRRKNHSITARFSGLDYLNHRSPRTSSHLMHDQPTKKSIKRQRSKWIEIAFEYLL